MKTACHLALAVFLFSTAALATPRASKFNLVLASAQGNVVGCTRDTDCKGERICVQSSCQDPQYAPSAPPNVSTPPSAVDRAGPGMSVEAKYFNLERQIHTLEESKPSLVGGILLTALGGVIFIPGFAVFLAVDIGAGLALMLLGSIPLAFGIALWAIAGGQRTAIDKQIDILEAQKRGMSPQSYYPGDSTRVPVFTVARF